MKYLEGLKILTENMVVFYIAIIALLVIGAIVGLISGLFLKILIAIAVIWLIFIVKD